MKNEERTPPPIIAPPSQVERVVVPPILTEEEKRDPKKKAEKKTFVELVFLFFTWLSKDNVVGTWVSFGFHFFVLMLLALVVQQGPRLPQSLLVGGYSKLEDGNKDGDGVEIEIDHAISSDQTETAPDQDSQTNADITEPFVVEPDPVSTQTASEQGGSESDNINKTVEHGPLDPQAGQSDQLHEAPQDGTGTDSEEKIAQAFASGGGFELRTEEGRGKRGGPGDPTEESELAVDMGLRWLAHHQDPDGGWSFHLGLCGKAKRCVNPEKTHPSRTAATGISLMAFLGAGHTHLEGEHKKVVERGLRFLLNPRNGVEMSAGYNLTQQTPQGMYSQGIATIALCEAYGMVRGKAKNNTRSKEFELRLRDAAQSAVHYIEAAQVQQGKFIGGWRYRFGQPPGDMSVTGWQILALKSAILSGIEVKSSTLTRAELFLNATQYDEGREFNYLPFRFAIEDGKFDDRESIGRYPNSRYTCTAIGHLSRMYLGAGPGFTPLDEGISLLDRWGPLKSETRAPRSGKGQCNLYYAYYGTLALHHYGGSAWNRWFEELRELLIHTQEKAGHEAGSWFFPDPYCDVGGRLLNTALAVMILEVRYRYMSLYDAK